MAAYVTLCYASSPSLHQTACAPPRAPSPYMPYDPEFARVNPTRDLWLAVMARRRWPVVAYYRARRWFYRITDRLRYGRMMW